MASIVDSSSVDLPNSVVIVVVDVTVVVVFLVIVVVWDADGFVLASSKCLIGSHTQVVVSRVVLVISMLPKRFLKNSDLNVVRNCLDIKPYKTKSIAAFIRANKSINSPKGA